MPITFIGGKKINRKTVSEHRETSLLPSPEKVVISLKQHIGLPAKCVVSLGEHVAIGQLIGEADGEFSANVHSSVSGIVNSIEADEEGVFQVEITSDDSDIFEESHPYTKSLTDSSSEELIDALSRFGVVGTGGAGFPTHTKLKNMVGRVNKFLINCVESEPYMTKDLSLLRDYPQEIIGGIKIMMKILCIKKAEIVIGEQMLETAYGFVEYLGDRSFIDVSLCSDKYPQGDERQLIAAAYKTEIPYDRLPHDTFSAVFNIETCYNVYKCLVEGKPITKSLVTVDGDGVEEPQNVLVPIGSSVADVIKHAHGLKEKCKCVIVGGSMMGEAINPFDTYVTKTTGCITCLTSPAHHDGDYCINCARCDNVCPMHIPVRLLNRMWEIDDVEEAKENMAHICVGCGVCSYVCPTKLPLKDRMEELKGKINIMEAENE